MTYRYHIPVYVLFLSYITPTSALDYTIQNVSTAKHWSTRTKAKSSVPMNGKRCDLSTLNKIYLFLWSFYLEIPYDIDVDLVMQEILERTLCPKLVDWWAKIHHISLKYLYANTVQEHPDKSHVDNIFCLSFLENVRDCSYLYSLFIWW